MARTALNLSIPDELRESLQAYCEDNFTTPSVFIRHLLVQHLRAEGVLPERKTDNQQSTGADDELATA